MTEFDDSIKTMATQIAQLAKRLQTIETQLHGMAGVHESFAKLGKHAATCEPENIKNEIKSLKADMLELNRKFENVRDAISTGKASMQNSARITPDDLKQLAPARIQAASLDEIVKFVEGGS